MIVRGVAIPVIPNSAPLSVITEMIKSAAPVFPIVREDVFFEPIETVPKSTAAGANVICACGLVVTVPLRLSTTGAVPESP